MKTLDEIQAEYSKLINQRELITQELYRLEGEARLIKEETKPVEEIKTKK